MSPRKLLIGALLVVGAIISISWLVNYLTTAQITITALDANAKITLDSEASFSEGKAKELDRRLSKRVKPGNYVATVRSGAQASLITFRVEARQSKQYQIKLKRVVGTRTITAARTTSLMASNDSITYLDRDSQKLQNIKRDQISPTQIDTSDLPISGASWNNQYGIARSSEADNQGFLVHKESTQQFTYAITGKTSVLGSASNFGSRVAYASGSDVYIAEGAQGKATKVFTAPAPGMTLYLGNERLVAGYPSDRVSESEQHNQPSLLITPSDGKAVPIAGEVQNGAWSGDGRYFAFYNDKGGSIINQNNQVVAALPPGIGAVSWRKNSLIYGIRDEAWSLEMGSELSEKIANTLGAEDILALAVSGSDVYGSIHDDDGGHIVQFAEPTSEDAVQSFTPYTSSHFKIEYTSYGKPKLLITTYGIFNGPRDAAKYASETAAYRKEAVSFLKARGISASRYELVYAP